MRISDLGMQQILLQAFQSAQSAAQDRQIQLASGQQSQTYGGYGADALRLVTSEGVITRASAFESAAKASLSRLETQGASLEIISTAVADTRDGFVRTLATGNAELLLPQLETNVQRIITALNVDLGGTFLFGGTDGSVAPISATSLSDIGAAASIDALFTEGERSTLAVEAGVSVDGGPLASDIARDLFAELQDIANAEAALGPFVGELTAAQRDFILEKVDRLDAIANELYREQGLSAVSQGQAADAATRNARARDLAETVAADIESVDIAEAITLLEQDQLAIQAAAQALATATETSLLNFI